MHVEAIGDAQAWPQPRSERRCSPGQWSWTCWDPPGSPAPSASQRADPLSPWGPSQHGEARTSPRQRTGRIWWVSVFTCDPKAFSLHGSLEGSPAQVGGGPGAQVRLLPLS